MGSGERGGRRRKGRSRRRLNLLLDCLLVVLPNFGVQCLWDNMKYQVLLLYSRKGL